MLLALLFVGAMMALAACGSSGSKDGDDEDFSATPKSLKGTVWYGYASRNLDIFSDNCNGEGVELRFISDDKATVQFGDVLKDGGIEIESPKDRSLVEYTYDEPVGVFYIRDDDPGDVRVRFDGQFTIEGNKMQTFAKSNIILKRVK